MPSKRKRAKNKRKVSTIAAIRRAKKVLRKKQVKTPKKAVKKKQPNKVTSSKVSSSPKGTVPVELFDGPYTLDLKGHQREDVAPDGRRFQMVENSDDFPIVIVQNWPLELRRIMR